MRLVQLTLVAGALAAAVAFAGVGRPDTAHGSAPDARSVTVTGTASVQAVPNRAGFSAGVVTERRGHGAGGARGQRDARRPA